MEPTSSYVTLAGLPLAFALKWPFHKSASGGDFQVLHGLVTLADGSGLHANIAVHLSSSIYELFPSLEQEHAGPVVINALRKWTDRKELEFLKSTKLQPLPLSSRFTNFKARTWSFENATDDQIVQAIKDKLYWVGHKQNPGAPVRIDDPIEALYLGTTTANLLEAAKKVEKSALARLEGGLAYPTDNLIARSDEFESRTRKAFEALQMKHAFESAKTH